MRRDHRPCYITGGSLTSAWSEAFLEAHSRQHELVPLNLRIDIFENETPPVEIALAEALDEVLRSTGNDGTRTVANTVFPQRQWIGAQGDREKFMRLYLRQYGRLKNIDQRNRSGTYFGRLIEPFPGLPEGQLEKIINLYRNQNNVVKMKLQATLFSLEFDNRGAMPGFPCLQQLSFAPYDGRLSVNAFYASQQILRKGFGNYCGLIDLASFMACEMDLEIGSLNVLAGTAKLGIPVGKTPEFARLIELANACVEHRKGSAIG